MARHTEAVAKFRGGIAVLDDAMRGSTPELAAFVPAPGKWTIRQLLRHLADTEFVVGMRFRQIISEDRPTLIPFDQDAWAAGMGYEGADPSESLTVFRSMREDNAKLLESLPAEAFDRLGVHPERGTKTLLEWVELFGGHVFTHAGQIRQIVAAETTQ